MVSTKLIEKLFVSRQKEIDCYNTQAEAIQDRVFHKLVENASDTEWGKNTIMPISGHTLISSGYRSRPTKT